MSLIQCNLQGLTVDQLVQRFIEIGIAQDQAERYENYDEYNRLYALMTAVDNELRARGNDARLALLKLYDHANMQVRLKAAIYTLPVAPKAARDAIEAISLSNDFPQAGDAGILLQSYDEGRYNPT
jgi:hypothetical protein